MAKFKPYKLLSSKLSSLPIVEGQLILATDTKKLYFDIDSKTRILVNSDAVVGFTVSGKTVTYTKANGTTGTFDTQDTNTIYNVATTSANGLMSKDMVTKLSGIESGAQVNTITGVKGNSETNYRTGNINITKANIGLGNVENKTSATIRGELTKANVTTALGYTPAQNDTNTTYTLTQDANNGHKIILTSSSGDATTITIPDNNTTYSAGTGISLNGTTINNSGVRSISTGTSNGTISVNTNGTSTNVAVKGLGSLAYKSSLSANDVGAIANSLKGANNGVAELDANGKVPSAQLPSYVDDVIEYTKKKDFPTTGETGKIYIDKTTNLSWRWGGSSYVEISPSLALGTTSSTAFRGDQGKTAYDHAVAKGSAFSSGLYKITTNAQGHVTAATAVTKSDITALGIPGQDTNTTYGVANKDTNGLMSSSDKTKLDGIASGAQVNTITGIKGNAESSYRTGNINITPANLGLAHAITSGSQTTTSNADGGSNVYTFTDASGNTSTFTVKNGSKGSTGVKGTNGTSAFWFTGTTVTGTSTTATSFIVNGSKAGDMYLNTSTQNVYKASAANSWIYVCNIKGVTGAKGATGTAAGFGTPTATVDANTGTPSVTITTSGNNTAKVFNFAFKNLKGATGPQGPAGKNATTTAVATQSVNGLMSAADKTKLDGLLTLTAVSTW